MVFFSELKGRAVLDNSGAEVGRVIDLIFVDGEQYAPISHIIYIGEDRYRKKVSWETVKELAIQAEIGKGEIRILLNKARNDLNPQFEEEKELLVSGLLDKQIIDIDGLKVVRVNDVQLAKVEHFFSVVGVCVGTKSLLRRLSITWLTDIMMPKAKEKIIQWSSVEPLDKDLHTIHVKMKRSKVAKLHPSEIADIMEDLSQQERTLIFNGLDVDKAAKTLVETRPEIRSAFFKNLKVHRIVSFLERMGPDQAADIISMMPKARGAAILEMMHDSSKTKVKEILKYPVESAGALMRTDYIAIPSDYDAQRIINLIRQTQPSSEMMYRLYVVDKKHHLLGVLTIRSLLLAGPDQLVTQFMKQNIIKVKVDTSKEETAKALSRYNLFVLPVVDELNMLKGVVTADDVVTELIPKKWRRKRSGLHKYKYKARIEPRQPEKAIEPADRAPETPQVPQSPQPDNAKSDASEIQ